MFQKEQKMIVNKIGCEIELNVMYKMDYRLTFSRAKNAPKRSKVAKMLLKEFKET